MYEVEDLPTTPWWRRVLLLAVTLVTVWLVMSAVTGSPVRTDWKPPVPADKPACTAGQTQDCVGGTASVIVVPSAPASGAPPR